MARIIYTGFHAVEERVRRHKEDGAVGGALHILYAKPGPRIKKILALAQEAGLSARQTDAAELDKLARDHRGIVLVAEGEAPAGNAVQLEQWLLACPERATVLVLDGVTDPHNVGAVIRSCDQFGADLLVVPERNATADVQQNQTVARASAGASAWVPVATVTNKVRALERLKEAGFWIYAADAHGQSLLQTSFAERTCLVMGSEGSGIARLVQEHCDLTVSIPTCGKIDSLNVSVAAGVLLYERRRQALS